VLTPELPWQIRAVKRLATPMTMLMTRKARSGADRRSLLRESRTLDRAWEIRHDLMAELAELSSNRRHIVASDPHHYVHKNDPDLVITAIRDVVRSARTNAPLAPWRWSGGCAPSTGLFQDVK
jgi:malate synthase